MLCLGDVVAGLTSQAIPEADWAQTPLGAVVVDSRQVRPGDCFVALRGQHQDGHAFLADALARGALALIAEEPPVPPNPSTTLRASIGGAGGEGLDVAVVDTRHLLPFPILHLPPPVCFIVQDSLAALQGLAAAWRRCFRVRVVGVTGSVGKTTTKEVIHSVLSRRFRTLKSEGNYNNEIGLPLTLLQLTPEHERAVLEMGMYALGEIALLCHIAQPVIGVVTNVGPTHLERLGTIECIARAKAELVEALPADGVAVLNGDDEQVMAMAGRTRARVVCYGLRPECQVWADEIVSQGLEGVRFRLHYGQEVLHVKTPLLGRHSVHTALAAAAVGLVEGESWEEIVAGLQGLTAYLRLVAVPGPRGSTLLDDTYNASPVSTIAALNLLVELPAARRIAVLGDMLELGSYEEEGHRKVGLRAREVADVLITVGRLGRIIGQEALAGGLAPERVWMVDSNQAAIARLRELLEKGDMVLVKGSRGLAMEEIVNGLARPANGLQEAEEEGLRTWPTP